MPQIIQCPDCQKTLRVPDNLLGKTVRCPTCKTMFTAQAEEEVKLELIDEEPPPAKKRVMEEEYEEKRPSRRPAAEEEEEERVQDRPRRRRMVEEERPRGSYEEVDEEGDDLEQRLRKSSRAPRGSRKAWRKTRAGVNLVLIGIFTLIAAYALIFVGLLVIGAGAVSAASSARTGAGPSSGAAAGVFGGVGIICCSGVVLLAAFILTVTGNAFCASAPPLNGAKTLAIISLVLVCLQVLFAIIGGVAGGVAGAQAGAASSSMGGGPPASSPAFPGSNIFGLIGNFLGLAYYVVFLVFLRQCAITLRERGIAKSILFLLIYTGVVVVVSGILVFALILGAVAVLSSGGGGAAGLGAGAIIGLILILLMALGMLVWYIISLFQIRGAITKFVDG